MLPECVQDALQLQAMRGAFNLCNKLEKVKDLVELGLEPHQISTHAWESFTS